MGKKDKLPDWENVVVPENPSKKEVSEWNFKKKKRDLNISRMRANVLKKQIVSAYEILENIRFDYLSDTMFRDYITEAKKQLECAIGDFLLSNAYWKDKIDEYDEMSLKDYRKMVANWDKQPTQSKCVKNLTQK